MVERAARGETVTITKAGTPVAELRARGLSATALVERWRTVPRVDATRLRADIDAVLDPTA